MTTIEKTQMQKRLNRARLLEFEKELESRLDSLNTIENEMKVISEQRREWLENISKNHSSGSDIYIQRVELVKAQAEQLSLTLKLDVLKLESQYETQRLAKLVEFTRPLNDGEREEDRVEALKLQGRKDNDSLRMLLQHSLDHRLQVAQLATELLQHLTRLQHQSELEQADKAQALSENLQQYCANMTESSERAATLYGDIVREYLILRHNAQVAKEILLRNQNDAMFARQELQLRLQKMTKDAIAKRRKHESAAAQELKVKLRDLRAEVMRKEKLLEETKIEVRELKQVKKGEVADTLQRIAKTKKRFLDLQQNRRETTIRLLGEVEALRQAVHSLTVRQLNVLKGDADTGIMSDALDSSKLLRLHLKNLLQRMEDQHRRFHRASHSRSPKRGGAKIRFADEPNAPHVLFEDTQLDEPQADCGV